MKKGAGYHHGNLRRALVEATVQLVDSRGTEGFTLRAAAKLAGVSDGAPYHHFADKEALLAAVAEEGFVLLYDEMKHAAARAEKAGRHQGRAMGVAYVLFAAKYPERFRLMFGKAGIEMKRHPELARAASRAAGLVKDTLSTSSGKSPDPVWVGAWALVHGLSVLAVDGHLGKAGKSARQLEQLVLSALETTIINDATPETEPVPRSARRVRASRPLSAASRGR